MKTNRLTGNVSKLVYTGIIIAAGLTLGSCTKKTATLAIVTTLNVTEITPTGGLSGGDVTSDGGAVIESRGVCWNTSPEPTIMDNILDEGTGTGNFTADLTSLSPNTQYYLRAFATNSQGTAYGDQVTFTTDQPSSPVVTTNVITGLTSSSATSGGTILSDGGMSVTAEGVCWSTSHNPTTNDNKTSDGTAGGSFTSSLTGLQPVTTYYVRAYASNSLGTGYGNELSFTTPSTQSGYSVSIQSYAFSPATITVPAGSTITWTNNDAVAHTVTSDNSAFDSGTIPSSGTYSRTFPTTGTFPYHCTFHPYMTATVIVN